MKISNINHLKITPDDNVVVLLEKARKGEIIELEGEKIKIKNDIQFGHKIAIESLNKKDEVIKYGEIIGYAKEKISKGEWVHNHNIYSPKGRYKGGGS